MKTREAVDYYGGIKGLAQVLDIWPHVVGRWGEYPPKARQYELEVKTEGKLKAEEKQ